jgi:hypothetical protein
MHCHRKPQFDRNRRVVKVSEQRIIRWSVEGWVICAVAAFSLTVAIENSLFLSLGYLAIAFFACVIIALKFARYRLKAFTSAAAALLIVISPFFRVDDVPLGNPWLYGIAFLMFAIAFFLPSPKD